MFNGILFQESLQDLVKGIRANRRDEAEYMRRRVADIGEECRTSDMEKKAVAVLKLAYLQMMGHSINFASFYITEVMSSPVFATKRIGYLSAAQSFSPATDVLLLTTNQFKKDLTNGKVQDCSQALTCLGKLITEELGRDLESDIAMLLSSPRPYIRKKALLVLYRLILVYPDTLSVVGTKFRDMLGDPDPSVVCAAVTVTCELAKASPRNFLALAPVLYQLLTSPASNNWMLIKIVKLMGVLTPLEPRLGRKLVEPLVSLMRNTRAKSLLYECCSTVTSGLLAHPEAVELCAQHLGNFMVDSDQNLKYLGLLSMRKLIKVHPDVAMEHRDLVLDCLDDDDVGIRIRALEIVSEFLNSRNYRDLSRILLRKLRKASDDATNIINAPSLESTTAPEEGDAEEGAKTGADYTVDEEAPYRDALAEQLLRPGIFLRDMDGKGACGYEMLSTTDDFTWYFVTILNGLAGTEHLSNRVNSILADQIMELTSRVEAVRTTSVKVALTLFESQLDSGAMAEMEESSRVQASSSDQTTPLEDGNAESSPLAQVNKMSTHHALPLALLSSASWIIGEYAELITDHLSALKNMMSYQLGGSEAAQVAFLSAILKIYAACPAATSAEAFELASGYINSKVGSEAAEVQERAWLFSNILGDSYTADKSELQKLFEGKLKPVDTRAQSVIPVPEGLDLDKPWIDTGGKSLCNYLIRQISNVTEPEVGEFFDDDRFKDPAQRRTSKSSPDASSSRRVSSPFFLGSVNGSRAGGSSSKSRGKKKNKNVFNGEDHAADERANSAVVLVPDEVPDGVDMSKVAPNTRETRTNSSLDANLGEVFASGDKNAKRKVKGKKKRKKKKNGADTAPESSASNAPSGSLIDFDTPPPTSQEITTPNTTPKYLAESDLLM